MNVEDIAAEDLKRLEDEGYSQSDLSLLAPTEVEALLGTPSEDDDREALERVASSEDKPDSSESKPNENTDGKAEAADLEDPAPFVPRFESSAPDDADAQIKASQDAIAAARERQRDAFKQYDAGTIDGDAYAKVVSEVEDLVDSEREKISEIRAQVREAEADRRATEQVSKQAAEAEWSRCVNRFMNGAKTAENIDYRAKPGLLAAFNVHLKALANADANKDKDGEWFLREAHRLTKEELGIASTTPSKKDAAEKPGDQKTNKTLLSEVPPTLRGAPAAALENAAGDEFAHMRSLDGVDLERAYARLTPDQQERWLAA